MTELQEQHSKWADARERLWPAPVRRPPIHRRIAAVAVEPLPPDTTFPTPFNFFAPPSYRALIKFASLKHGIDTASIISWDRHRVTVAARDEAIWLVHSHCGKSLPQIGAIFQQDHTTVLYSLRKYSTGRGKVRPPKMIVVANEKDLLSIRDRHSILEAVE